MGYERTRGRCRGMWRRGLVSLVALIVVMGALIFVPAGTLDYWQAWLFLAGWLGILAVFRANTYAAAIIQVADGQTVISTGPYAIVRHPMYAAALLMLLGIPVSLGSWWGVLIMLAILPALAWRLIYEERV